MIFNWYRKNFRKYFGLLRNIVLDKKNLREIQVNIK